MKRYEVTFRNTDNKPVVMYLQLGKEVAAMKNNPRKEISEAKYKAIMRKLKKESK